MANSNESKLNWEIPTSSFKPDYNYRGTVLNTDYYEWSMAQAYFKKRLHKVKGVFDVFFRRNPAPKGQVHGYTIACGLEEIAKDLKNYKVDEHALSYLKFKGFDNDFIEYLSTYKWEGTMKAVPEGTVVYPYETVIQIECDLIGAFLIETFVLQKFNMNSLIATKANRIVRAAEGRDVMEFGGRRAQGETASLFGARAAIIGGCIGTANCLAEAAFGPDVKAIGTMSHAWIESFPTEFEAYKVWAETNPFNVSLLVDTYNALERGVPNAIKLDDELQHKFPNNPERWVKSLRLDSGDLAYQAKKTREMLDERGKSHIKIIASNSLDEDSIRSLLLEQKAPIDSFGVGENLITSADCPVLGGVYKLTALDREIIYNPCADGTWSARMKCSDSLEKAIIPGKKEIYRVYDEDGKGYLDIIAMSDEELKAGEVIKLYTTDLSDPNKEYEVKLNNFKPLLIPIIVDGELVYEFPSIKEIQQYVKSQTENEMWEAELRSTNPHVHFVDMTENVYIKRRELYHKLHELSN